MKPEELPRNRVRVTSFARNCEVRGAREKRLSARRAFVCRKMGVASGTSSRKASGSFRPCTISKSSDMEINAAVLNVLRSLATAGKSSAVKKAGG